MAKEKNNIVVNNSKGYGYNYASLSDISMQGYNIPKMRTGTEEGREYVYYHDGNEWVRGAEIVIPEGKGMNKAQLYGSALTYARRYTTLMAECLACDDDKTIEDIDATGEKKKQKPSAKATEKQIELIRKLYTEHDKLLDFYGIQTFEELSMEQASQLIANKKGTANA